MKNSIGSLSFTFMHKTRNIYHQYLLYIGIQINFWKTNSKLNFCSTSPITALSTLIPDDESYLMCFFYINYLNQYSSDMSKTVAALQTALLLINSLSQKGVKPYKINGKL